MGNISLLTAFTTGLLTFFAPCTFVAIPSFIAYITSQISDPDREESTITRSKVMMSALIYAAGFLLVFTLLGFTAIAVGNLFLSNKDLFTQIGGGLMILGGLFMLFGERFKSLQFLYKEKKVRVDNNRKFINSYVFPFIIGITTALAWTPCVGPVLGGILLLASASSESPLYGGLMLFVHGLGIMIPFMIIAFFFDRASSIVKRIGKYSSIIYKLSALILIFLGFSLMVGAYDLVAQEVYKVYILFGFEPF